MKSHMMISRFLCVNMKPFTISPFKNEHGELGNVHLEGSFETPAPRQKVWEFLLNPNEIGPCFPDLQSLEVTSADSFRAKLKVGLSVVRGTMEFEFRTVDKVPPQSAKLVGTGRGVGSTVEIQTGFNLEETGPGTKVAWVADVNVGGIMAGLGSKLLDSTSAKMVEQTIENFKSKLNHQAPI